MTNYFEQENFDYNEFVNSLVEQVPDLCNREFDEIRVKYIVTKIITHFLKQVVLYELFFLNKVIDFNI